MHITPVKVIFKQSAWQLASKAKTCIVSEVGLFFLFLLLCDSSLVKGKKLLGGLWFPYFIILFLSVQVYKQMWTQNNVDTDAAWSERQRGTPLVCVCARSSLTFWFSDRLVFIFKSSTTGVYHQMHVKKRCMNSEARAYSRRKTCWVEGK